MFLASLYDHRQTQHPKLYDQRRARSFRPAVAPRRAPQATSLLRTSPIRTPREGVSRKKTEPEVCTNFQKTIGTRLHDVSLIDTQDSQCEKAAGSFYPS